MAPGLHEVAAVCKTVLGSLNLDDDTLEYVAGCVVDEDALLSHDDLADFLLPYAGDSDSEEAEELAGRLHAALARKFDLAGTVSDQGPAAALAGVTLGSLVKESDLQVYEVTQGRQQYIPAASALDAGRPKDAEPAAPAARARAKEAAAAKDIQAAGRRAERAAAETDALNAEVEAASQKAAELRGMKGFNFNAAVTVGPFDLPHPSGAGTLLENATFTLTPGRKYALIGRNGKGKSTLLRNIAARRVGGIHPAVSTHYVSQDVNFSADAMDLSPVDVVLRADIERRVLLDKAQAFQANATLKDNEEHRACLSQLDAIDADSAGLRATRLLVNLGFSDELLNRQTRALSGGWRVRVALAAALFAKPDILFLDEPTNHLSMQAVLWLAHEISSSPTWSKRIVVLVSHDRFFINETCTDMLHISGVARRLTQSKGNYTSWARAREEQQRGLAHRSKVRLEEIAKCRAYIASGQAAAGNTASSGRRLQIQKLEREAEEETEELKALQEDKDLPLTIHSSGALEKAAVSLKNVGFAYPGHKPLFRGVGNQPHEFNVDSNSRIVLVGENGNGKTTLVKLLLGELEPTEGEVVRHRGARFAIVNQHHADQIDLAMTPLQFIRSKAPGDGSEAWERFLRSELANSGIDSLLVDTPAAALSGGQRSRLAMVAVSVTKPHVLFMDEPTNNLDVSAAEALAAAIEQFEGAVVLVSHDQHFVSRVAREVWTVGGGEVKPCACGFEEYWARMLCAVDPSSAIAVEALEAYARKKRVSQAFLTGGQASREALARELAELRAGSRKPP